MKRNKQHIKMKIERLKEELGHQERDQGCGTHDSRPRRQRTRQAQKQNWKKEYELA